VTKVTQRDGREPSTRRRPLGSAVMTPLTTRFQGSVPTTQKTSPFALSDSTRLPPMEMNIALTIHPPRAAAKTETTQWLTCATNGVPSLRGSWMSRSPQTRSTPFASERRMNTYATLYERVLFRLSVTWKSLLYSLHLCAIKARQTHQMTRIAN
jgi:hypothetical protein